MASLGGVFLYMADKTLPHMHFGPQHEAEGLPTHLKRTILLVFSITLHNIPEGLAVGVAFGAAATADNPTAAILAAARYWYPKLPRRSSCINPVATRRSES